MLTSIAQSARETDVATGGAVSDVTNSSAQHAGTAVVVGELVAVVVVGVV